MVVYFVLSFFCWFNCFWLFGFSDKDWVAVGVLLFADFYDCLFWIFGAGFYGLFILIVWDICLMMEFWFLSWIWLGFVLMWVLCLVWFWSFARVWVSIAFRFWLFDWCLYCFRFWFIAFGLIDLLWFGCLFDLYCLIAWFCCAFMFAFGVCVALMRFWFDCGIVWMR